jgi:uncharacterized protein (TIGR02757 family)
MNPGRVSLTPRLAPDGSLRAALELLYDGFNYENSAADPIQIVRRFGGGPDREIAGFCAAALAFGRVASVLRTLERLMAAMGPTPAAYVRQFEPRRDGEALARIVHRWIRGHDLVALLWLLRQMVEREGSIERFFLAGHVETAADVGAAIDSFADRALALDLREAYGRVPARPGVGYFFPRPSRGSACKRLNLFLRWMVRRDALDLGVWTGLPPSALVIPLDTHVIRVGRCLRLTRYASPGWAMARDITDALRRLNPADPVRYDYALCHLGMMHACGFGLSFGDSRCPLRGLCRPRRPPS